MGKPCRWVRCRKGTTQAMTKEEKQSNHVPGKIAIVSLPVVEATTGGISQPAGCCPPPPLRAFFQPPPIKHRLEFSALAVPSTQRSPVSFWFLLPWKTKREKSNRACPSTIFFPHSRGLKPRLPSRLNSQHHRRRLERPGLTWIPSFKHSIKIHIPSRYASNSSEHPPGIFLLCHLPPPLAASFARNGKALNSTICHQKKPFSIQPERHTRRKKGKKPA